MGSWIHDGFLDSWNPCVKDFRIWDLLESIIGFNKSFAAEGVGTKNFSRNSRWISGFTISSWIHERFLNSRWVLRFWTPPDPQKPYFKGAPGMEEAVGTKV